MGRIAEKLERGAPNGIPELPKLQCNQCHREHPAKLTQLLPQTGGYDEDSDAGTAQGDLQFSMDSHSQLPGFARSWPREPCTPDPQNDQRPGKKFALVIAKSVAPGFVEFLASSTPPLLAA